MSILSNAEYHQLQVDIGFVKIHFLSFCDGPLMDLLSDEVLRSAMARALDSSSLDSLVSFIDIRLLIEYSNLLIFNIRVFTAIVKRASLFSSWTSWATFYYNQEHEIANPLLQLVLIYGYGRDKVFCFLKSGHRDEPCL